MQKYITRELVIEAMKMAIADRCSMCRNGDCWDNPQMESFFKTLKTELVYHPQCKTRAGPKLEIFEYIEVFYNRVRLHSALGY